MRQDCGEGGCGRPALRAAGGRSPRAVGCAAAPARRQRRPLCRHAQYGLVHISVGDLLRAEVAAGTPAGKKAKSFMDNGDLVPNEVGAGGSRLF